MRDLLRPIMRYMIQPMKDAKTNPPKIYEIINWLFGPSDQMPDSFIIHKTKLNSLVPYISEQFWLLPKAIVYINKHLNELFNIPDPIENLILIKKIIKDQSIVRNQLFQIKPEFNPNFIDVIEKELEYDEGNAKAKATMMYHRQIPLSTIKKMTPTKANLKKQDPEITKKVHQVLETAKKEELEKIQSSITTDHYITEKLTQELIDKEELILFDVSLLKKTNRVLFIFIDKNNHKKYYTVPFSAKIYISKQQGIINNDYIETITPEKFNGYRINDIKLYTRLKYMINGSYKKLVNGES